MSRLPQVVALLALVVTLLPAQPGARPAVRKAPLATPIPADTVVRRSLSAAAGTVPVPAAPSNEHKMFSAGALLEYWEMPIATMPVVGVHVVVNPALRSSVGEPLVTVTCAGNVIWPENAGTVAPDAETVSWSFAA